MPVIEGIHAKIKEATSKEGALNMRNWHTCDTTHCRAGWVVILAGPEGKKLEEKTSTLFAAMQIYKKSSPNIHVSINKFFVSNAEALKDIDRCYQLELQGQSSN